MNRTLSTLMLVAALAPATAQKKYTYVSVPNDPMGARIYTLENGLQVYLSQNKDKPRVQTDVDATPVPETEKRGLWDKFKGIFKKQPKE